MTTENELLEMGDHFKKLVKEKNKEINELKKFIVLIYGLVRATDDNYGDYSLIEIIRGYCSEMVEKLLNIDSSDED
tara:strand:- start:149 stop:376 length:228 start_codon:yes stop_codon:yes gene_type:complete